MGLAGTAAITELWARCKAAFAAASHAHAASDIASGTLPVARGGTGASTAAAALSSLGAAPLASPTFTGAPKAPTAAAGTSTTQVATTAFVASAVAAAGGAAGTVETSGSWTVVRITSAYALLLSQVSFTPSGWTEWGRGTMYSNIQSAVSWPVTVKGVIYCDAEVQHDTANTFCNAYLNAAPTATHFPPFYVTSRASDTSLSTTITVQRVALVRTA